MKDSSSTPLRKAPSWLAPLLAVILVLALVWGLGVTVFRGVLVNLGLPEPIRGSSSEQFAQWEYSAQLSNLAQQAEALAGLADGEVAEKLEALNESLSRATALLGQVRYADELPAVLPMSYSPEAATTLASSVMAIDSTAPLAESTDPDASALLVRIVFETSLDARAVITAVHPETKTDPGPVPLASSEKKGSQASAGQRGELACLRDPSLLQPQATIPGGSDAAPIHAARALDRGYALDYVLQLNAARTDPRSAESIERQRRALNDQLDRLRTAMHSECPDTRRLAYQLPEGAGNDLGAVAADLETDLANELLLATTAAQGDARLTLTATTWNLLTARQDSGTDPQLLGGK